MSGPRPVARSAAPPARTALAGSAGWTRFVSGPVVLWFKGYVRGGPEKVLRALADPARGPGRLSEPADWLAALDGHFALVAEAPGATLAAVDRIRSIPLVYGSAGAGTVIAQEGARLAAALGLGPADADADAVLAVGLAGYTIGDDTLYRGVRQLGPGSYAVFAADGRARHGRYHRYRPWEPRASEPAALRRRAEEVTVRILENLMASADGRPIVVPLSAGLDSRLIVSGLKALGYPDIRCFAYGLAGNHESIASRRIAERLGLPWRFVPYTRAGMRRTFESAEYAAYVASADSLTGVHFPQDYLAVRTLERDGWLPRDAVIVNGQSGDFLTGNHIPATLRAAAGRAGEAAREAREARIIDALVEKHYKQWRVLQTPANMARLRRRLAQEIADVGGLPDDPACDYGIYEWCEFQDRQSKYVVNGQRLYEHLGYDWRLPLWDAEYLDFWAAAPLEAKAGQRLYKAMLMDLDWGGVWRDIPLNAKAIRPRWIVPLRLVLKALHAPLGRERWHAFERRYLEYFMGNLCADALVPWTRAATDGRGHRSAIAWHIERYLMEKGLALDGGLPDTHG